MGSTRLSAAFLGGVSAFAMASAAFAQAPAAPAAKPADAATLGEIVVTGSRVIANGNNSPTPVTVVSTDQLMQLQPTTVNDALNNLPVFQGSRGQTSTPNTTGLFGGGNPATTELNLRNLSAQRTLVLFDGQRIAPSNALGVVDADSIPQELLQRVDVVTGGVSAVYGSDAIAGVVNYITDTKFNGLKAEASYGQSNFNDDQTWRAGFAAGTRFGDGKGHVEFSYDHYDDKGIPHRNERPYYACSLLGSGNVAFAAGSAQNPYEDFCNVHSNQNTYGGLIANGVLKGDTFDTNGVLTPFVHGTATGTSTSEIGGEGPQSGGYASLKAPVTMDQAFGRVDYDLTDAIHFHTEATATWKRDTTYTATSAENTWTLSATNAFLPATYQAQMAAAKATTFTMSQNFLEIPLTTQTAAVQNVFINSGFDGKIDKYNWALDVDYSSNVIHDTLTNNLNVQNLAAAEDAVVNPATGQIVCNASLTNAAYANCVPFNPFGPTAASQAAINYVTATTHFTPTFTQIEVGGHIGGDIFNLPAGPVKGDASFEYRKQSFSDTSDASPLLTENCAGVRYNCAATTQVFPNAFAPSGTVSQSVKEGAFEFEAPIVKDMPFFQALNLNGAVRYTSYDFGGNNFTYKVGIDWHVTNDLTLRATQSQDIEAPTLGMLFQPPLTSLGNNLDLLTNTTYQVVQHNIGNPNLVSEVGHTTTAGFVWRPEAIPGFSLSVDGYHIIVDNALSQVQGQASATQQVCDASGGSSVYCTLQTRALGNYTNTSAANVVTAWYDLFINVSTVETYGADIELNYANRLFDRPYAVRLFTTWQPHLLYSTPGQQTFDYGGVAFPNLVPLQDVPQVQLTGTLDYAVTPNFFVDITERWRSAMILEPSGAFASVISSGAGAYATTNLNLSYHLGKTGNEVYLNIRDIFNALPQIIAGQSNNPGYPVTDDPDGRFITLGFRARF